MTTVAEKARSAFVAHSGILRTSEALAAGIHPRTLYSMRDDGQIQTLARGVYRLADLPPLSNPDLSTVAKRIPQGVICLISALAHHQLTTQVPHEIHLALPRTSRYPRLAYPPLRVYRFSGRAMAAGVDIHMIDGVAVSVYNAEKTLADCFKYRGKIGMGGGSGGASCVPPTGAAVRARTGICQDLSRRTSDASLPRGPVMTKR